MPHVIWFFISLFPDELAKWEWASPFLRSDVEASSFLRFDSIPKLGRFSVVIRTTDHLCGHLSESWCSSTRAKPCLLVNRNWSWVGLGWSDAIRPTMKITSYSAAHAAYKDCWLRDQLYSSFGCTHGYPKASLGSSSWCGAHPVLFAVCPSEEYICWQKDHPILCTQKIQLFSLGFARFFSAHRGHDRGFFSSSSFFWQRMDRCSLRRPLCKL